MKNEEMPLVHFGYIAAREKRSTRLFHPSIGGSSNTVGEASDFKVFRYSSYLLLDRIRYGAFCSKKEWNAWRSFPKIPWTNLLRVNTLDVF